MNELINYRGVSRTAPATPGLLKTLHLDYSGSEIARRLLALLGLLGTFLEPVLNNNVSRFYD